MLNRILERKIQTYAKARKSLKHSLQQGFGVIAEIKRASPSKGKIADIPDAAARAALYEEGGASAISVLTDEAFEGSLEDLETVARYSAVPVLRKDFLIHPRQIAEAAYLGADAVLLIAAILRGANP